MKLDHVGLSVEDLDAMSDWYATALDLRPVTPFAIEPLGESSPIAAFLAKNPSGGMHHICYEVENILAARDALRAAGARVLGDGEPKIGAHGKPVLFLHPKDFQGTLIELEEV